MNEKNIITEEKTRVLIVDDENDICKILQEVFKMIGLDSQIATNGNEALDKLKETEFDIVFTDLKMPYLDGFSLIKKIEELKSKPVIVVMTGHGNLDTAVEVTKLGAYDYISKPFKFDILMNVINRALEKRNLILENSKLKKSLRTSYILKMLASSSDIGEVLLLIIVGVYQELTADSVGLFLKGKNKDELDLSIAVGFNGHKDFFKKIALDVFKNKKVLEIDRNKGGILAVPVEGRDEILGVLIVEKSNGNKIEESDRENMEMFADEAALAIEKLSLIRSLEHSLKNLQQNQAQLLHAGKLSVLGEMVASLAHEIRNPLSAITLGCDLLNLSSLNGDIQLKRTVDTITSAAKRLNSIIENLVGFSKKREPKFVPLDINKNLERTIQLVHYHLVKRKVENEFVLKKNLQQVLGDEGQLQQVFLNIVLNACDAMEKGGRLTIATLEENPSEKFPDGVVVISFSDTGCGISEEHIDKIFDSFYTTKEEKGTGLGLSISRRIIREHGGVIDVESKPGFGSKFIIRLPVYSEKQKNNLVENMFTQIKDGLSE